MTVLAAVVPLPSLPAATLPGVTLPGQWQFTPPEHAVGLELDDACVARVVRPRWAIADGSTNSP